MKILYYSPHPYLHIDSPSGYGRHMREMIRAFEQEHEVQTCIIGDILYPHLSLGPVSAEAKAVNLKTAAKKVLRGRIRESVKDLMLIRDDRRAKMILDGHCEKFKPDLIYERSHFLMQSGTAVAKARKIRHVWELNSPFLDEKIQMSGRSFIHKLLLKYEKANFSRTDLAVFVTQSLRDYYLRQYPDIQSKSLITPNGILPGQEATDPELVSQLLSRYKQGETKIIGFVGSIQAHHGMELLIHAFAEIADKNPGVKLMIVGGGETLPAIRRQVEKKELAARVIFTGSVPASEVFAYMKVFDIGLMAKTNWYCSPVKLFEYGLAKLPIVAPDVPTVREIMEHKKDALLIPENASSISSAIEELLSNPEQALHMAENFHHKVCTHFTWQHNVRQILAYFSSKTGA